MLDALGLSRGAKIAWAVVLFVLLFIFIPALLPSQANVKDPEKKVYQNVLCYPGQLGTGRHVLICDPPATPSIWTPPTRTPTP